MKPPVYWTTKDGTKMNVDDMDENHVRNAFKMVLRNLDAHIEELKKKESNIIEPRGEMAQMLFNQENEGYLDDFHPWE